MKAVVEQNYFGYWLRPIQERLKLWLSLETVSLNILILLYNNPIEDILNLK